MWLSKARDVAKTASTPYYLCTRDYVSTAIWFWLTVDRRWPLQTSILLYIKPGKVSSIFRVLNGKIVMQDQLDVPKRMKDPTSNFALLGILERKHSRNCPKIMITFCRGGHTAL